MLDQNRFVAGMGPLSHRSHAVECRTPSAEVKFPSEAPPVAASSSTIPSSDASVRAR